MGAWTVLGLYLMVGVIWAQTARVICMSRGSAWPWAAWLLIALLWFVIIPFGLHNYMKERQRDLAKEHPAIKQRRAAVEKEKHT